MSGGETEGGQPVRAEKDTAASSSSSEAKKESTLAGYEDVVEGLAEEGESEGEDVEDEEALRDKRGDGAGPQTVLDKSQKGHE